MASKKLDKTDQAQREDRLCEYRAMGWTYAQIMLAEDYKSVQAASRATLKAIRKRSLNDHPDAVRDEADMTGDFLRQKLSEVIVNPPLRTTAIGKAVMVPGTCTCGAGENPKNMHTDDCRRQFVVDESVRVRAISELRKLSTDRVDMHGARKRQPISESAALRQMYAWLAAEFPERYAMTAEVIRELDLPVGISGAPDVD